MKYCVCALACAMSLFSSAADYKLKTNASQNDAVFTNPSSFWEDMVSGSSASAITSTDDCYVMGGRSITTGSNSKSFPGNALHFGKSDGSESGLLRLNSDFSCPNLRWHCGEFFNGSGGSSWTLGGNIALDCPGSTHYLRFLQASSSVGSWALNVSAALGCEYADLVLDVLLASNATKDCYKSNTNPVSPLDAQIALSGNNSGFKGKIKVSKFGHLALAHANAAGAPDVVRADAIELAANSRLTVANSVTPNAARGITITGAGAQIHARTYDKGLTNCNAFELPMPIAGGFGFTKMGDGTVTLSGTYTAGDIVVSNGTLVLAATGSFPSGLKVTVHDGARLVQNVFIPAVDVDCKGGGTYTKGYSYSVPYDPDTGASTPLDFTGGIPADDEVLPISLSNAIKVPFATTNRIDMALLPSDTTATAADFADLSPKTYGLPKTSFEIEARGSSKVLVLVARPVVVSVKNFANGTGGLGGSGDRWSDGQVARPGFDYLVTNAVDGLKTEFLGDSATFGQLPGEQTVMLRDAVSHIGKATVYPGKSFSPNYGTIYSYCFGPSDSIYLPDDGSEEQTLFKSRPNAAGYEMRLNVNVPLSGDGTVKFLGESANGRNIEVTGDNSGFTGKIKCSSYSGSTATNHTMVHVFAAEALGGAPERFVYNALQLDTFSHVVARSSFALDAANRGIYVKKGGFCVSNDVTLTVRQPLRVNGTFCKEGEGTLALGGAVSFGEDGTTTGSQNTFLVREGAVKVLSDAAVDGFATTFSDGTKILLDVDAGLVNGFTGSVAIEEGATVTVAVSGFSADPVTLVPICTVPDDSLDFALTRVNGFRGSLVKTSVTLGGTACTRYAARYVHAGFMILMR